MPSSMPKEMRRVRMKLQIPFPGFALTFQTRLSEFWSCTKTPVAPKRLVTTPATVASTPERSRLALAIIVWMTCAPWSPIRPRSSPMSWPCTASRPKKIPATPITISSRGASEKIV
jgi:hypothetical protein